MHYNVRSITIMDGDVMLDASQSDSKPREYFKGVLDGYRGQSVHKQLAEVGRMLYCGDIQFTKSSRCRAKQVYDSCKRRHGTWKTHYLDGNGKKYRERFASEFARRMCA